MNLLQKLLWIILAHYIADYPLQSDFLAQTKGKYSYSLLVHSIIYGLTVSLCFKFIGVFAIWKAIALILSHIAIDYKKATAKNKDKALTTYLYIDQGIHLIINFILMII